ncbi:hypothetical protein ACFL9T_12545 [Thermodesulfobacteriota bacterium]
MKKYLKILLFGFLAWLIPFVVSIFFYSKEGKPIVDIFLFKSIMIVVGAITGAFLMVLYLKKLTRNYLNEAIIIGLSWFAINIILDLIILLPMMKVSIGTYFAQIGLRYLVIPVMSIAMGYVAENKKRP